jgi:hypothetical protein
MRSRTTKACVVMVMISFHPLEFAGKIRLEKTAAGYFLGVYL